MMECSSAARSSRDDYVRMVRLKSVDYWHALYAAVDPRRGSALGPFLERFYELAQYLNDVEDYEDDLLRGQPNILTIVAGGDGCPAVGGPRPIGVDEAVETQLAAQVLELGQGARELDGIERAVAQTKLSDLLETAHGLGLFGGDRGRERAPADQLDAQLDPSSDLADVLEQAGPAAIVDVSCGVCGHDDRVELFRKQGFYLRRCRTCSHVYVSPRIGDAVHALVERKHDDEADIEVQRIYAEHICGMLRHRTPGARLLDVGFGHGYLLQMAQVYGFVAHGIDSSPARVEALAPLFGARVARASLGLDPIPWQEFDAVVLSHVLERVGEPAAALREVAATMTSGAWIYLAVPDVESMDYRIFGGRWEAISPLVHLHYFTERSLRTALQAAGYIDIQRIRLPAMRDEVAPRWMRLMRQLGGSESSELTMLARRPDDPAFYPRDD
jgi:2-polyprenyl-3-methyl-5-hydroxy-6-metoxy-1,4-benzoquinol methylase